MNPANAASYALSEAGGLRLARRIAVGGGYLTT